MTPSLKRNASLYTVFSRIIGQSTGLTGWGTQLGFAAGVTIADFLKKKLAASS